MLDYGDSKKRLARNLENLHQMAARKVVFRKVN